MHFIPSEFSIGGVYFPPYLLAGTLGVALAAMSAVLINKYRLSRYFYHPPLVFLALAAFYTGLIATFLIPA